MSLELEQRCINHKQQSVMKLAILTIITGSAAAFAPPSTSSTTTSTALRAGMNGWVPNANEPCYGLPGAISPQGYFDPLGLTKNGIWDLGLDGVKRYREAEIMHSRVAMMAVVGYIIGESTPTIAYGTDIHHTIANDQIPEIPRAVLFPFFLVINIAEALRASKGWVEPGNGNPLFTLRESYYPGDLGFDPLKWKPKDPKAFEEMQAKELSNGRLAMFGVAGM
jgi:hypothetical protein